MIFPHLVFIAAYAVYALTFIKNSVGFIYPVYLAPFVVYLLVCMASYVLSLAGKSGFLKKFSEASASLYAFAVLLAAPVIVKVNLPNPHNFALRKLEILLGASYVIFISILSVIFLRQTLKKTFEFGLKRVFMSVAIFFFIFYFFLSLWFNFANPPTGDEPAYLLTAHSIVKDGDLDLKNNFENRDYRYFFDRELKPQTSDVVRNGKIYSYHPAMFSLLISPFYLIAGRLGVTVLMNALSAMFIAMIFYFLYKMFGSMKNAVITAGATGFLMPAIAMSNSISGDVVTGLFLITLYVTAKYHRQRVYLFSFLMAAAVWIHVKAIPVCAGLAVLYLFYSRKDMRNMAVFIFIQALNTAAFMGFNYILFGVVVSTYTLPGQTVADLLSTNIFRGAAAFFFDRQLGLFAYAPVFVFIISGFYYMIRSKGAELLELTLIILPYFGLISMINNLGGGSASPRYLVPVLFYFSMLLSAAVNEIRSKFQRYAFLALLTAGFLMSLAVCMIPWFRWDWPSGENNLLFVLSRYLHFDLTAAFPTFQLPSGHTIALTLIWAAAAGVINFMFIRLNRGTEKL